MSTNPNRIVCAQVACPAPGCGRLYRPNHAQRAACSNVCIERMRKIQGLGINGGVLVHPSWKKGAA